MWRAVVLGIFQVALCTGASAQPVCVGDCNGDDRVTVDEIIQGVDIALGTLGSDTCAVVMNGQVVGVLFDANSDGRVTVDELLQAVDVALNGCIVGTASGTCLRPGASGLIPCAAGTAIRVFRCDDADTCVKVSSHRTRVGQGAVDAMGAGSFLARYDAGRAAGHALIFEAQVDAQIERDVVFGPAGAGAVNVLNGSAGADITIEGVVLSPVSEAAVRILDQNGLQNFSATGVQQVADAVVAANADTSFAGLDVEAAATLATTTAQADPGVQEAIQQAKFTPTPTATPTPAPTPSPTPRHVEGTWEITTQGACTYTLPVLVHQDGDQVFGTAEFPFICVVVCCLVPGSCGAPTNVACPLNVSLTGSVSGDSVSFTFTRDQSFDQSCSGCVVHRNATANGQFQGAITGGQISGTYNDSANCSCPVDGSCVCGTPLCFCQGQGSFTVRLPQ
jgi:hypothetical protein